MTCLVCLYFFSRLLLSVIGLVNLKIFYEVNIDMLNICVTVEKKKKINRISIAKFSTFF